MKYFKTLLWAGLATLISLPVFGDVNYENISSAAQRANDLSRQALVMIFGDVVISPIHHTQNSVIGTLFGKLNGCLCAIAIAWFFLVTIKTVVKAGHEGKVFHGGRSIAYPLMTLAGFMMIVPTSSGWSFSQLVMLWAASVMGVGSANILTDTAANMMTQGYSMVTQPTAPSTRTAARGIFEMNLCKYSVNREMEKLFEYGMSNTPMMQTKKVHDGYITSNGSALCGSAKLPEPQDEKIWNILFQSKVNTSGLVAAQKKALDDMQSTLDKAARYFVDTYISKRERDVGVFYDLETQIQHEAIAYERTVNTAINQIDYKDSLQSQLVGQLKSAGWASLGAWYLTFATANSKTNAVANATPVVTGMSKYGEHGTGDLLPQILSAYRSQVQNSPYTPPLGTQLSKDDGAAATAQDPKSVFVGIFKSPMQKITNNIATERFGTEADFSNQVNPLIKMQQIGDWILISTESLLTAYTSVWGIASAASNSPVGWASKIFLVDTGAVVKDILGALAPMFYFIMLFLLGIGFALAVFLPAVPFIFWMAGLFNWIVSVLVGCAAGPLWAATHLGAEEDKGSRSAYGYIFLIDMMIRPSLMVLGFFFASVAAMAGGTLLNLLFASALANANADSMVGLLKMIGWLMIYARIATFGVTRVFGLQTTLPDYVISFIGGRESPGVMGGVVDNVKNMFGAAVSGTQRVPGIKSMPKRPAGGDSSGDDGIK